MRVRVRVSVRVTYERDGMSWPACWYEGIGLFCARVLMTSTHEPLGSSGSGLAPSKPREV